jgi:hypothetical protein
MILLPVLRPLTGPRPPGDFAARLFVTVILPPLLFFAMFFSPLRLFFFLSIVITPHGLVTVLASSVTAAIRASALPFSVAPVAKEMD